MAGDKQELSRLELYQAGKLEERRTPRTPQQPQKTVIEPQAAVVGFKLRPSMIVIALTILLMLVLALIGM